MHLPQILIRLDQTPLIMKTALPNQSFFLKLQDPTEALKPNEDELKRPLEVPECEIAPNEVWYPPDWFLTTIHDMMIKRYCGWTGLESGLEPYHKFIKEARNTEAICRKAQYCLKT
jgi:hypothetical protein